MLLKLQYYKIFKLLKLAKILQLIGTIYHHHHVQEGLGFHSCSLYPQNEIGPSISSSVVLCVFVLLVY